VRGGFIEGDRELGFEGPTLVVEVKACEVDLLGTPYALARPSGQRLTLGVDGDAGAAHQVGRELERARITPLTEEFTTAP
jgi:hypothetical protein